MVGFDVDGRALRDAIVYFAGRPDARVLLADASAQEQLRHLLHASTAPTRS
jgi:hypothetical protein